MTQIPGWKDQIGKGWHGLLDQAHAEIMAVDPRYEAAQVKEKFGALRLYLDSADITVQGIAHRYEDLSGHVCEECGEPGENKPVGGWWLTLCTACREKAEAARKARFVK